MARFIVIEGIDGSGTTTQAASVAAALTERGRPSVSTFEPTGGAVGKVLRELLSGRLESSGDPKKDRRLFAHLFAADRHDHLHRKDDGILATLAAGTNVVCARYVLSSYAYEGESAEELHFVESLNAAFPVPDLTVYLDCPVDVSLERISSTRDSVDVFENREKLASVRRNYEKMVQGYRGRRLVVDATRDPAEITAEITALVLTDR